MILYHYKFEHQGEFFSFEDVNLPTLIIKVQHTFRELNIVQSNEQLRADIQLQTKGWIAHSSKSPPLPTAKRRISLADAARAASALVNLVRGKHVDQTEADRRANICKACPFAVQTSDCVTCGGAAKAAKLVQNLRAKQGGAAPIIEKAISSKFCDICGCSLPFLLITNFADISPEPETKNASRPDRCWLKTTSPNFTQQ